MSRVMASQTKSLGSGKNKYKASDAVALMPLLVGFKPAGRNNDLGITDPLCTYRPPSADVLRQSWKLHNTETLDAVAAAMDTCGTNCLFALNCSSTGRKYTKSGANTKSEISNHYIAVLGRIDKIEKHITDVLKKSKDRVAGNTTLLRADTIGAFKSKLGMSDIEGAKHTMKDFIKQNSNVTETQMRKIFDIPNPDSRPWAGLSVFDSLWTTVVTSATLAPYEAITIEQEKKEIRAFTKIIELQKSMYTAFTAKITNPSEFQTLVQNKYLKSLYGESIPNNTKVEGDRIRANTFLNKYLWNVILERFEILDSTVSTFFSLICATRNIHVPLVRRFMQHAIFYCTEPLLACVTKPVLQTDTSSKAKSVKDILGIFNEHSDAFLLFLTSMFSIEESSVSIYSNITALTPTERRSISTHIYDRLLHRSGNKVIMLGPRVDNNERTPIYTAIEKLIDKKMETVPMVKMQTYIPTIKKTTPAFLTIFRTPEGTPYPVTAIREALEMDKTLSETVKQIAYIRIYLDSTAYGVFHYEEDNASALKTYMSASHNPLSLVVIKLTGTADGKAKNDPQAYDTILNTTPNATILSALELKPDFTPDSSGGSKKQQKSPSPAAGEGEKKKRNRNNKNKNNKTTITTVVTKQQNTTTGEKKKQTPPKGKKAKGGK